MAKNNKIRITSLVLLIPIVHVLANVTTNYFGSGIYNPGFIRLIYFTIIIVIVFIKRNTGPTKLFTLIVIFLLYNLILVLLNDNLLSPFINYVRGAIPLLMIFVSFKYINELAKLESLLQVYIYSLAIYVINIIISNYFDLGESAYLEDSFHTGGALVNTSSEIAIIVICGIALLIIKKSQKNYFKRLIIVLSIIIIFVTLRRGAILILFIGFISYTVLVGFDRKVLKNAFSFLLIVLILSPLYSDVLKDRYEKRAQSREGSITNLKIEGRYLEFEKVPRSLNQKGTITWLFGTHNMNSQTFFGGRNLHVGYMEILHGSGILGTLLFLSIIIYLFVKPLRYRKYYKGLENYKLLLALYYSALISLLFYLLFSVYSTFIFNLLVYLLLGGILGVFQNSKKLVYESAVSSKW